MDPEPSVEFVVRRTLSTEPPDWPSVTQDISAIATILLQYGSRLR